MKTFLVEGRPEHAGKYRDWLRHRGGLAVWTSQNLADRGATAVTPADRTERPGWQYTQAPTIVTDPAQVGIYTEVLYKRVRVALRVSGNGLSMKLTDHSQTKLDKALVACQDKHGNSHYRISTELDGPGVNVYYTTSIEPLDMEVSP